MKKYFLIIVIFITIIFILNINKLIKQKGDKFDYNNFKIVYTSYEQCEGNIKTYHYNGRKINFVCFENFSILSEENEFSLQNMENLNFDKFIDTRMSNLEKEEIYRDGGTIVYKEKNGIISNNGLTVIMCHKKEENNLYNDDVYIGDLNMSYQEHFCK